LKANRSLHAFRKRFFARSLLAALLYLFQPGPMLIADEQGDLANLLSLKKQVTELYQAGKFNEAIPIAQKSLEFSGKPSAPIIQKPCRVSTISRSFIILRAITPKPNHFFSAR
jgi:hypothetical protein